MHPRLAKIAPLALVLATALSACAESATAPGARSTVFLAAGSSAQAALIAEAVQSADDAAPGIRGRLTPDKVASINVTITRVQALRAQDSESDERKWIDMPLAAGSEVTVNLLALPEGGIQLATGALPAGTYGNVRLFVRNANLVLKESISIAPNLGGPTLAADTPIPLRIPSAEQTGLKIPTASFVVADGDESITIDWDVAETIRGIQTTGQGLQIAPVLRARGR